MAAAAAAGLPDEEAAPAPPTEPPPDRAQAFVLLFLIPFLNEIKDSWEFAAVPLHFLAMGWPLTLWCLQLPSHALPHPAATHP